MNGIFKELNAALDELVAWLEKGLTEIFVFFGIEDPPAPSLDRSNEIDSAEGWK